MNLGKPSETLGRRKGESVIQDVKIFNMGTCQKSTTDPFGKASLFYA